MSRGQRTALVVGAAVIAVLAFVLLQPEDEDSSERSGETTTQQADDGRSGTTTEQTAPDDTTAEQTTPDESSGGGSGESEVEVIRVRDGEPVGGQAEIEAKRGDTVRFEVVADADHEVHLHGYDLSKDVTATRPASFRFKATETGIFEVELEDTHTPIAELKVEP